MNRRLYAIHRWLSAIALVQLGIWVVSGLFFAVIPDRQLKGAPLTGAHSAPIAADVGIVPPGSIIARLGRVDRIELVGTPDGPFYRVKVGEQRHRFDARSGEERSVDEIEAKAIAARDQPGNPAALRVTLIERDPHIEYRSKPLPAWRVLLNDDAGTAVYVDAVTGEVTARRNDVWRTYDFLWGLHLMDYGQRDTRNHPLLAGAAVLGLLTVLSGVILWVVRAVRWWRRPSAR